MPDKKKLKKYKVLKIISKILLGLLLFFALVILFIRSPWGQNIIVSKVVSFVKDKTGTEITVNRLFVTFSGNVYLENLYVEDLQGDTLVYSKKLEASVALIPLIKGEKINIKSVDWNGLKANIYRKEGNEDYNFSFISNAFSNTDSTSTSNAPEIQIGTLDLNNFDIDFKDAELGVESTFKSGKLLIDINQFDLLEMNFHIDEVIFENSIITYNQNKEFLVASNSASKKSSLPFFKIDDLNFVNVKIGYNSKPEQLFVDAVIGDFKLKLPEFNLDKQIVTINSLELATSNIKYISKKTPIAKPVDSLSTKSNAFQWPNWTITTNKFSLSGNHILYQNGSISPQKGVFNANAMEFHALNFKSKDILIQEGNATIDLEHFSFKDNNEFNLKNISFNLIANNSSLSLKDFQFNSGDNNIAGAVELNYPCIDALINKPEATHVNINFPNFKIALNELFLFQPQLKENYYLATLAQKTINGTLKANGTLKEITIPNTSLAWGSNTKMNINGSVSNVMDVDVLSFNINQFNVASTNTDIQKFIHQEELGFSIPKKIVLTGSVEGSLQDINANTKLVTSEGEIKIDGNFNNAKGVSFGGVIEANSVQLGKILKNDKLGPVSFEAEVSGKGDNINSLDAKLATNFTKLEYNAYDFSNVSIKGDLKNGKGGIDLKFKDNNLNLNGRIGMELDSVAPTFHVNMDLIGADLQGLQITQQDIRTSFKIEADFKGDDSNFDFTSKITDGVAVYDGNAYAMSSFNIISKVRNDSTYVDISSRVIDANLVSNSNPKTLLNALKNQFKEYLSEPVLSDSLSKPSKMKMDIVIRKTPAIEDVYLESLQKMDTVRMQVDFDEAKNELTANLSAPFIQYNELMLNNLKMNITSDSEDLKFNLEWGGLHANPIIMDKTSFNGVIKNQMVYLNFDALHEDEKLAHINSEISMRNDSVYVHINPKELVLNKLAWDIAPDNQILLSKNYLEFTSFDLNRNQQHLFFNTINSNKKTEKFEIQFENFKLATIVSLLNPDEHLVNGSMKGNFIVEDPFYNSGIVANATIENFKALEQPLGTLVLDANSKSRGMYNFNLSLKGEADLDVTGDYQASESGAKLNLDLVLNEIKLKTIEGFTEGLISESEGNISGEIKIEGTVSAPQYQGNIRFNDAALVVNKLKSKYELSNENIKINNKGIYLNTFTIEDINNNTFLVQGDIETSEITNPVFNFTIKANDFQAINSTEEDNDLFYGKVNIDADVSVKGDLKLPIVRGKLNISEESDFTVLIPESQLDLVEREGIVIFVNRENPNAILTRRDEDESSSAVIKGYDIEATTTIGKGAIFKIILDERSGDNIQVSGSGDFNMALDPNGRISLSGRYEVDDGHYEASLYNLIKRRFDIAPGGSITWNGDPLNAKIDVQAIYKVETSAAPLMATQTSAQSSALASKFRQEIPFLVYLNVDGVLLQPEISFNLDIPEDEQGSLGGEVYARVQQLNDRQEELNKQVFSLLVLNRFFPGSTSDGSAGGATSIARDNVNKVLSGQLNNLSNKIIGDTGVDLNFGLDSYTDYQGESPQNRTQLDISASKKLFNDRLVVQVGSEVDIEGSSPNSDETSPIIGNLSVEYLLTENGRFRLKGFRKNEFESVIDGQLIVTGIALIFNREFNKFSELWKKSVTDENIKKEKKD